MNLDWSESFQLIFTMIRLYLGASLNGISITPSISPIFRLTNVFNMVDLGIEDSILGMHMAFGTMDMLKF